MIASRKLSDLVPKVALIVEKFIEACREAGYEIIVTCTYRDDESQNALYAIGRTIKGECVTAQRPMGRTVTNAKGGESFHQYKVAIDIVVLRHGKAVWDTSGDGIDDNPADDETDNLELWQRVGAIGESVGLTWAGRWVKMKEYAHFQYTGGLTLKDFQNGRTLG